MKSNYDQLVDELQSHVSVERAFHTYEAGQKHFNSSMAKNMRTIASLQKSAAQTNREMHDNRKRDVIERVPRIMAKAQAAYQRGEITAHELVVIEATKNRLCTSMASRGMIS